MIYCRQDFVVFDSSEIPDFLSSEECAHIIQLAESKGLRESTTLPDPLEKKGIASSIGS